MSSKSKSYAFTLSPIPPAGSSEAVMMALLAMKFGWRNRRKEAGQDASRPNLVSGAHVHVVVKK